MSNQTAAKGLKLLISINNKLSAIRSHTGKPLSEIPKTVIKGAVAREVFYQAFNLYQKSDRLAQEIARDSQPLDFDNFFPRKREQDILKLLDLAKRRIDLVITHLNINYFPEEKPENTLTNASFSDLYTGILKTNQLINQLLDHEFSPSEVYQQVSRALLITIALYDRFPEIRQISKEPKFIPGKTPTDVFGKLLDCYALVREIAMLSNMHVLEIVSVKKNGAYVPSEVYDIATLLVSELSHIHKSVPIMKEPQKSYFPGRKYPSDVFQRASYLEKTLTRLHQLIVANPDWHKESVSMLWQ